MTARAVAALRTDEGPALIDLGQVHDVVVKAPQEIQRLLRPPRPFGRYGHAADPCGLVEVVLHQFDGVHDRLGVNLGGILVAVHGEDAGQAQRVLTRLVGEGADGSEAAPGRHLGLRRRC